MNNVTALKLTRLPMNGNRFKRSRRWNSKYLIECIEAFHAQGALLRRTVEGFVPIFR